MKVALLTSSLQSQQLMELLADGIHIDMDRLKKGEVKYDLSFPHT